MARPKKPKKTFSVKSLVNLLYCKFLQEPCLVVSHHGFLQQCPTTASSAIPVEPVFSSSVPEPGGNSQYDIAAIPATYSMVGTGRDKA